MYHYRCGSRFDFNEYQYATGRGATLPILRCLLQHDKNREKNNDSPPKQHNEIWSMVCFIANWASYCVSENVDQYCPFVRGGSEAFCHCGYVLTGHFPSFSLPKNLNWGTMTRREFWWNGFWVSWGKHQLPFVRYLKRQSEKSACFTSASFTSLCLYIFDIHTKLKSLSRSLHSITLLFL